MFIFPAAVGHLNPSLPLARGLVARGWEVHFLSIADFKAAIEDTGAKYYERDEALKAGDITGLIKATFTEYADPPPQWALNFGSISNARLLPAYIAWVRSLSPSLIVYCPVLCAIAHFTAMTLGIPDVSLLTAAGPGFFDAAIAGMAGPAAVRGVAAGLAKGIGANEANAKAVVDLREQLGCPELTLNTAEPLICDYYTSVNLVTTTPELEDPMCEADVEYYQKAGKKFVYVGPLLDVAGAKRGAGVPVEGQGLMKEVGERAVDKGLEIVYVSMGTVVTADGEHGWADTSGSALTGRELCQSVFRAVFEELGGPEPDRPLIVVSVGRQKDALEGIDVPPNAVCSPFVPQVDLLRLGKTVLFVTHGGQNSLMESAAVGTPVVVCPGFGDQVGNGAKVEAQGWGLKVDRPKAPSRPDGAGHEHDPEAVASYRQAVRKAVSDVLEKRGQYGEKAQAIAAGMKKAGGVESALRTLEETAGVAAKV